MTIHKEPGDDRVPLEGRLEGISLPDLIQAICLPRRTGTLSFTRGGVRKSIYIKDGQLIFAASNVEEERLGETLLRSGAIGFQQLEQAVSMLASGRRLGGILVEMGVLAPPNLVRGLLHQVKEIILSLFSWESGSYRFDEGSLPTAEVITLNISTSKLICDGIRRITSWPRIVRNVGRAPTIYRLTREGRLLSEDLDLGPAERVMLELLEKPSTVVDLCRSVFLPNFDVYQYLWAFRILGIVQRVEPSRGAFDVDLTLPTEAQGNLEDLSVGPLLMKVCRQGETGVLYLAREAEERSIHIRAGSVIFATSSRIDDALTTFLLRRGVIGLRDKEEIERRLLSNKRPGTILREMGILSQEELVRFVREQLRETVLSTFSWEQGDWRFVSGDLPTFEDITLDMPVEELIVQGIRVVRDWSRVRVGCGGLGTLLRKVGESASLTPGVEPGLDEAEVMAALETPRTVESVCGATQLPDYRVAQILWAMQILGRVERVPEHERIEAREPSTAQETVEHRAEPGHGAPAASEAANGSWEERADSGRDVDGRAQEHATEERRPVGDPVEASDRRDTNDWLAASDRSETTNRHDASDRREQSDRHEGTNRPPTGPDASADGDSTSYGWSMTGVPIDSRSTVPSTHDAEAGQLAGGERAADVDRAADAEQAGNDGPFAGERVHAEETPSDRDAIRTGEWVSSRPSASNGETKRSEHEAEAVSHVPAAPPLETGWAPAEGESPAIEPAAIGLSGDRPSSTYAPSAADDTPPTLVSAAADPHAPADSGTTWHNAGDTPTDTLRVSAEEAERIRASHGATENAPGFSQFGRGEWLDRTEPAMEAPEAPISEPRSPEARPADAPAVSWAAEAARESGGASEPVTDVREESDSTHAAAEASETASANPLSMALGFFRRRGKSQGANDRRRGRLAKIATSLTGDSKDTTNEPSDVRRDTHESTARTQAASLDGEGAQSELGVSSASRSSSRSDFSEETHAGNGDRPGGHGAAAESDRRDEQGAAPEASWDSHSSEDGASPQPGWPTAERRSRRADRPGPADDSREAAAARHGDVRRERAQHQAAHFGRGEASRGADRHFDTSHPGPPSISPLEAVGSGVLEEIERFNRRHREVYAVLRGAVGAGARNFVGASIKRLSTSADIFLGVEMDETGAFSPAALYERVGSLAPSMIRERLEALIEAEADTARELLEARTVQKMYRRLEAAINESVPNPVG